MRVSVFCLISLLGLAACENDPCEETICENGGTCEAGVCQCPDGFDGDFCELSDISRFTGTYMGEYAGCVDVSDQHRVTVSLVSGASDQLLISNLGDYACPSNTLNITAMITGNQVQIAAQTLDCGPIAYTYEGSGSFTTSDKLELTFSVSYPINGTSQRVDNCTVILEK